VEPGLRIFSQALHAGLDGFAHAARGWKFPLADAEKVALPYPLFDLDHFCLKESFDGFHQKEGIPSVS